MTSALEDIKSIDLEEWLTLNTASSPTKLKLGQTPNIQNVWTDEKPGSIITAPGYLKVGTIPSNNPVPFCINFFRTAAGTQTFVVSDNSTVWTTVDFQNFTSIITGLSSSFQLRGKVIRDKLWLTNGSDSVRTFDGTSVVVLDGTGGTPAVPKGRYIDYHDERVWLYHLPSDRSKSAFSALTDTSGTIITPDNANAWPSSNTLQVSEGDADFGTGLLLYRGYLHFFKQYSIWRLVGYDEYTYTRVKTRASTGTRFNESVQILDSLVHLIGVDGIYIFDGEESQRISDIIDPATASQTAFGFNQLQQPNTNNQFFEVTATADWNAGTVPTNLAVADQLSLVAADDSQSDFQAGAVLSHVDTTLNPGSIQLTQDTSGTSHINSALNQSCTVTPGNSSTSIIGSASFVTDGDNGNAVGFLGQNINGEISIRVSALINITTIIFDNYSCTKDIKCFITNDSLDLVITGVDNGASVILSGTAILIPGSSLTRNFTINVAVNNTTNISVTFVVGSDPSTNAATTLTEIEIRGAAFRTTGKFVSKTLDLGITPVSLGTFSVDQLLNGQTTSLFTQSSADGSSWGAETACTNGGAIGSTPQRYLRWGVTFSSNGDNTSSISAAYLPSVYVSSIHNTGGSIFAWGPFESERSLAGQTINFYYRTATTSGGIPGATWNLIVPGGVISDSVSNQYVQFKVEISGGDITHLPTVTSVTINWVSGSAGQPQTLQNVASTYWRNRYWLSAAGPGATEDDTILIRGKKTFNSPWMLKDWNILSFARFQDSLYGGSSVDGSIYQLDTGYSKNGAAMDSYFETGDFVFGGFTANFVELLVEAERTGPWNLSIGVSVDGGRTFTDYPMDLTVSTYDSNYMKRINLSYTTTRIRFRFRTNGIDTPFQVHRCIAFYKLEGERGSIQGDYR